MRPQSNRGSAVAAVSCALAFATLAGISVPAGAITIAPVVVELSPARRIVSVTMTNPGDQPISFQTQAMTWSQADGEDRYGATDEILVVPPIATIPPKGAQIFRVTTRRPAGPREQAFRVVFEDVSEETAAASDGLSVKLRFNHNLPVFVAPAARAKSQARLGPCTRPATAGAGCVRVDNDGARYAQLKALSLEGSGWKKDLPYSTRVLAGGWKQVQFEVPPQASGPVRIRFETTDGPVDGEIALPAR